MVLNWGQVVWHEPIPNRQPKLYKKAGRVEMTLSNKGSLSIDYGLWGNLEYFLRQQRDTHIGHRIYRSRDQLGV